MQQASLTQEPVVVARKRLALRTVVVKPAEPTVAATPAPAPAPAAPRPVTSLSKESVKRIDAALARVRALLVSKGEDGFWREPLLEALTRGDQVHARLVIRSNGAGHLKVRADLRAVRPMAGLTLGRLDADQEAANDAD